MNEERHSERPVERQGEREIERDSQLSAMFDGELPAAECELLARRLSRDEALRSQWSRYALIGAALRAERGVKLDDRVARRVQAALAQEPTYGEAADGTGSRPAVAMVPAASRSGAQRWWRFGQAAAGAGIAAGAAAVSIFWLRGQDLQTDTMLASAVPSEPAAIVAAASTPPTVATAVTPAARSADSGDYSTPLPSSQPGVAPPASLANYVVAHSEYSGPLTRRMALLSVVGSENQEPGAVVDTEPADGAGTPDAP